jgi:hypothetical protein
VSGCAAATYNANIGVQPNHHIFSGAHVKDRSRLATHGTCFRTLAGALISLPFTGLASHAENEVPLFDGQGAAVAYIAVEEDLTIYTWSGKPVDYLIADDSGGFHVYGFNGKHIGWFLRGVIWDQAGGASCVVKEALNSTQLESLKGLKELKPLKSLRELAPLRPLLSNSFGDTPCQFLLAEGGE